MERTATEALDHPSTGHASTAGDRPPQSPCRRAGRAIVAVAALGLLAAACGSGSAVRTTAPAHSAGSSTAATDPTSATTAQAGAPGTTGPTTAIGDHAEGPSSTSTPHLAPAPAPAPGPDPGGAAGVHTSTGSSGPPQAAPSPPTGWPAPPTTTTVPRTTTTTTSPPAPPPPTTTTTAPPTAAPLAIRNFAFLPSTLLIPVGTTVTVTNFDSIGHTWSSTTGAFDSGALGNGQSYSHTFTTPGTYTYRCNVHPSMTGTVVVQ